MKAVNLPAFPVSIQPLETPIGNGMGDSTRGELSKHPTLTLCVSCM